MKEKDRQMDATVLMQDHEPAVWVGDSYITGLQFYAYFYNSFGMTLTTPNLIWPQLPLL
jgi:hypothetical protein